MACEPLGNGRTQGSRKASETVLSGHSEWRAEGQGSVQGTCAGLREGRMGLTGSIVLAIFRPMELISDPILLRPTT